MRWLVAVVEQTDTGIINLPSGVSHSWMQCRTTSAVGCGALNGRNKQRDIQLRCYCDGNKNTPSSSVCHGRSSNFDSKSAFMTNSSQSRRGDMRWSFQECICLWQRESFELIPGRDVNSGASKEVVISESMFGYNMQWLILLLFFRRRRRRKGSRRDL